MEAVNIMGLDLSLTGTGIVVMDTSRLSLESSGDAVETSVVHSECFGFKLKDSSDESQQLDRMIRIAARICSVAGMLKVKRVFVEGPAYNQAGRLFHLGGLHFLVASQLHLSKKLPTVTVPASTARKKILGRGKRPKDFVGDTKAWIADSLQSSYGFDLVNDNINDALIQALYGLQSMHHEGVQ